MGLCISSVFFSIPGVPLRNMCLGGLSFITAAEPPHFSSTNPILERPRKFPPPAPRADAYFNNTSKGLHCDTLFCSLIISKLRYQPPPPPSLHNVVRHLPLPPLSEPLNQANPTPPYLPPQTASTSLTHKSPSAPPAARNGTTA